MSRSTWSTLPCPGIPYGEPGPSLGTEPGFQGTRHGLLCSTVLILMSEKDREREGRKAARESGAEAGVALSTWPSKPSFHYL